MNRKKTILLIQVLLITCFSCYYRDPFNTIIQSKNINHIQIIACENHKRIIKKNITDKHEIQRFLLLFKPTKRIRLPNTFPVENFNKNGEIIIYFTNNSNPLIICLDIYNGYFVTINSKQYCEKYSYQLGRFLLEVFSNE